MLLRDEKLRTLKDLMNKVKHENARQISKHGIQDREINDWMVDIGEEFGELCQAINELHYRVGTKHEVIQEATQLATLVLKLIEMVEQQVEA